MSAPNRSFDCSHNILLLTEGSCGLSSHDDEHCLDAGCPVTGWCFSLLPLTFLSPLRLGSHSSVDGKNHITLTLCRAGLSLLPQLLLTHITGERYTWPQLILCGLFPSHCLSQSFVFSLSSFLAFCYPPPTTPISILFFFCCHWPVRISITPLSCLGHLCKVKYGFRIAGKGQLFNFQKWEGCHLLYF